MSQLKNPYSVANGFNPHDRLPVEFNGRLSPDNRVPDSIMQLLEKTRGWILFFALLGFLMTALFVFVSAFMVFGGFISSTSGSGFFFFSSVAYVLAAVVFAIPSHFLWQLNYWIERASLQPTWRELEEVVRAQRVFWQVSGILAASIISLLLGLMTFAAFAM